MGPNWPGPITRQVGRIFRACVSRYILYDSRGAYVLFCDIFRLIIFKTMSEVENKNALLKSKYKHISTNQPYLTDICNEDDHNWWASDSGSSTGSYYSDTDSSVVEWESEIGPNGEVFYIESAVESLYENSAALGDKSDSPQSELTRRRSTRAGKLFRLIRRKESKRWSTRNKRINNSNVTNNAQEKANRSESKEVTFQDFQTGEVRQVILWVDPEKRHKLGRRATLCEAYFGIIPGTFSHTVRVMVAGFIPDGEAMNKNIKIGDWLRKIDSNNVTSQNLDQILSEITTPSTITLELQRVASVDVPEKLSKVNEPKQSMLAQYLINKDNSNLFMESFLEYLLGVIYLKTADLSEVEQELQGVLYTFPQSESKSIYSFLCTARGAFITLNHLLPSVAGPQPISTTVRIGEEEAHITYTSHDDELLLIALPGKCCNSQEAVKITEDIVRTLQFIFQSLTKCFTSENRTFLDHFFTLIMHRLISTKDSCKDTDAGKNLVKPSNNTESVENYKFRSSFSVANFIQLPRDAQIQIDAALSEMEAMDYRDWNEDPMDCQRLYTILGSCIYHKCYLLGSHLPHEDLIDVHSFLRHNGLLNLVNQEQIKCLVSWKQVYPSSCNRGNIDSSNSNQLSIPNGKWFLLVVGYGHDLLAVLLETGGCTAPYNDATGPDIFYVEEAQETLKHIQKIGVTTLASKWITSNSRPEVISYEEHTTAKSSPSITENLFGLIKSSDAPIASSKQNVSNPTVNKKQEASTISKKRSSEESPVISGSVYSLQTSEDSLSQGTGGVSEVSDEAMPILGRRATREKINSASRYSDDSDSDIDIYKNDSHVLAMDISNIRERLLNQAEYLIPKKLTAGNKNYLYHYVHLDTAEGILLSSIPIQNTPKDNKILVNFNKCVHVIHKLLYNTIRFKKMLNQDMDKTINRSLIAVKEHGVLFEWENTSFWVIGRLYTNPYPKELYVCYQDSAPQNLIEIAFQLHL